MDPDLSPMLHSREETRGQAMAASNRTIHLAVVIAPANVHDTKPLKETLEAIVVAQPKPPRRHPQYLCMDKACDNPTGRATVAATDYVPHIRPIGKESPKKSKRKYPARRWVVNRRCLGCPNAEPSWCATTKSPTTIEAWFSLLVPYYGIVALPEISASTEL